jgi:hypothetical protein
MIRPLTCLCFLAACGSGLYLYQAKHQVSLLDIQIEKTAHDTEALREQTRVLHAEWMLLNDPERLRQFADQYLPNLKPMQPSQFTSLDDLDGRLPAPEAPKPEPTPPAVASIPAPEDSNAPDSPAVDSQAVETPAAEPADAAASATPAPVAEQTPAVTEEPIPLPPVPPAPRAPVVATASAVAAAPAPHAPEHRPQPSHLAQGGEASARPAESRTTMARAAEARVLESRPSEARPYEPRSAESRPVDLRPARVAESR